MKAEHARSHSLSSLDHMRDPEFGMGNDSDLEAGAQPSHSVFCQSEDSRLLTTRPPGAAQAAGRLAQGQLGKAPVTLITVD